MTRRKRDGAAVRLLAPVDYETGGGRRVAEAGEVVADLPQGFRDWLVAAGLAEEVSGDGDVELA